MGKIHHIRLLLSLYCTKIQVPITNEGFTGKKEKEKGEEEEKKIKNDQLQRVY